MSSDAKDLTPEQLAELASCAETIGTIHGYPCGHCGTHAPWSMSFVATDRGGVPERIAKALIALINAAPQLIAMARRTAEAEQGLAAARAIAKHNGQSADERGDRIAELERKLAEVQRSRDFNWDERVKVCQKLINWVKGYEEQGKQLADAKALIDEMMPPPTVSAWRVGEKRISEWRSRRAALNATPSDSEET